MTTVRASTIAQRTSPPGGPPAPAKITQPASHPRGTPLGHHTRAYALSTSVLVFFIAWAVIAGHPWTGPARLAGVDPRIAQLSIREQHLREQIPKVRAVVERRFARYQAKVAARVGGAKVAAPVPTYAATHVDAGERKARPPVAVIWVGGTRLTRTRSS
jgi:hypothetical protein